MEKFLALSEEKRQSILNAALQCFAKHGYEKASIQDIAAAAKISKASMFQYFGSKKQLYAYLLTYCRRLVTEAFDRQALEEETDLLERILASARMKMESLKKQPFLTSFIVSAWEETAPEVSDLLDVMRAESSQFRSDLVLRQEDAAKFKNPADAEPVFEMLVLMAEGYTARYRNAEAFAFDDVMADFEKKVAMLRQNFYKEEYLG